MNGGRAAVAAAVVVLALGGCAGPPQPTVLTVFAAASLTGAFEQVSRDFEAADPGVTVVVNAGGSSGLAAQLVQGATADVFASASPATMATVVKAGLVDGAPVVFARNRLEIAVPRGNPARISGLADLARPELRIALCDAAVPCGAAAASAFAAAALTAAPDTLEQDVKAVLTKVELGEVDAGLVYRTDVLAAAGRVEGIPFAEADATVTDYPIAVLAGSRHRDAARRFAEYVAGGAARRTLEEAGFGAP